jgi:hypothetical protein
MNVKWKTAVGPASLTDQRKQDTAAGHEHEETTDSNSNDRAARIAGAGLHFQQHEE